MRQLGGGEGRGGGGSSPHVPCAPLRQAGREHQPTLAAARARRRLAAVLTSLLSVLSSRRVCPEGFTWHSRNHPRLGGAWEPEWQPLGSLQPVLRVS